jgi:transitional endoplasmic reticulum ATPase
MSRHPRYCPRHHLLQASTESSLRAPDLVRLWLLRLLVPLGGQRDFILSYRFNDALADAIGFEHVDSLEDEACDRQRVSKELRRLHADAESRRADGCVPPALAANRNRLKDLVGLSETDGRILELAVLLRTERLLDETADSLGKLSSVKVFRTLSVLLDLPETEIRQSLSANGVLARSGLVSVAKGGADMLRSKLHVLSDAFADQMLVDTDKPVALLKGMVSTVPPPELGFDDFDHAAVVLRILRPYLRRAVEARRAGANVLIHGEPGTGKSQLTRLLARDAGCELLEVAYEDDDGDPVVGEQRLRSFRAAQCFFAQRRIVLLFDEIEDVFDDGDGLAGRKSTAETRKAWTNRMLEQNPVPTIWLSNAVTRMDRALIRRFDLVMELKIPPRRQRARIVAAACGDLATKDILSRIAAAETVAPAVIMRAASVVQSIRNDLPADALPGAVERLVEGTLIAQGHDALPRIDASQLPKFYDPRFVNADADLAALADGIARAKSARLCLYGPPGTGKSAYGRWLAHRLDVPLTVRSVSSLVSPYVGVTERNIACVFHNAEAEGAILLLDEIDSFLRDRRGAQRTWEVTEVNEMLTQMECFGGIFIASTNLMEGLDRAALRRFDLKICFDYLEPDQAWQLFVHQCASLGLGLPADGLHASLARVPALTPGDFAAAARQHCFRPIVSAGSLLDVLQNECAVKDDGRRRAVGFV